jgi:hypothetical protein
LAEIDDPSRTSQALDWAWQNLLTSDTVEGTTYWGIRWSDEGAHIQSEVTAGTLMALLADGREADALWLLENLDSIRLTAPGHDPNGIGIVATPWPEGAFTGYGTATYPNALHSASTAWLGLAALAAQGEVDANPFRTVPEPGSLLLMALGIPLVIGRRAIRHTEQRKDESLAVPTVRLRRRCS